MNFDRHEDEPILPMLGDDDRLHHRYGLDVTGLLAEIDVGKAFRVSVPSRRQDIPNMRIFRRFNKLNQGDP